MKYIKGRLQRLLNWLKRITGIGEEQVPDDIYERSMIRLQEEEDYNNEYEEPS